MVIGYGVNAAQNAAMNCMSPSFAPGLPARPAPSRQLTAFRSRRVEERSPEPQTQGRHSLDGRRWWRWCGKGEKQRRDVSLGGPPDDSTVRRRCIIDRQPCWPIKVSSAVRLCESSEVVRLFERWDPSRTPSQRERDAPVGCKQRRRTNSAPTLQHLPVNTPIPVCLSAPTATLPLVWVFSLLAEMNQPVAGRPH